MNTPRIILLLVIVSAIAAFFYCNGQQYLTLEMLKSQYTSITAFRDNHLLLAIVVYGLIYITVTGLSLPGATILTLAGGSIFGLVWGTLIVSFASTIGATLAFLAARFLFKDSIHSRFGDRLQAINEGIEQEGAFYLFTLRLVPLFPFFVINLLMGLTVLKMRTFYWVSQVGMLAGTILYVNAGTQLAQLDSIAGILSPLIVGSFVLLGVFPLLAKKLIELMREGEL